jgi:putative oxidoreductase
VPELVSVIPNTIATKILSSSSDLAAPAPERWDSALGQPQIPKAHRAGRLIELASGDPKNAETLITPAASRKNNTMDATTRYLPFFGRLLIGLPFAMGGFGKLATYSKTTAMIAAVGLPVPPVAYAVAILVELGGGLLLVAGYQVRLVATALALYCFATALSFHSNFADQNQMINFLNNVMMAGGLLQIAAFAAGGLSLDNRLSRGGVAVANTPTARGVEAPETRDRVA